MQIKIVDGYVDGFAELGEIENGVEFSGEIPEGFRENCKAFKLVRGKLKLDEQKAREMEEKENEAGEISWLESWFAWYDRQVAQYNRAVRMGVEFDGDIEELDAQAAENQLRLRELRNVE